MYISIRIIKMLPQHHLILDIQITVSEIPLVETSLFHNIDFTRDNKNELFLTGMGPGRE